jgi:hypothetical protein
MPRKPTYADVRAALEARYGREIAGAYYGAIDDLLAGVDLQRLILAIQAGQVDAAIAAMNIDAAVYNEMIARIEAAYVAGGRAQAVLLPATTGATGARVVFRFDVRNPRAEAYLANHSAQLVTRIVDDQRQAIRTALTAGMEAGNNPRTVALDIVGRIDRATGRRSGGIVGLTAQQERFVANAREELSGVEGLKNYLTRQRRDKRFDRAIIKAIRDETPLARDIQDRAARNYANSLLKLRGDTIGRTEAMSSLAVSQHEAVKQAVEAGGYTDAQVRRVWETASDDRVRDSHAEMNGESVGLDEAFSNGLMYPGDPSGPVEEIANCRCYLNVRFDYLANIR